MATITDSSNGIDWNSLGVANMDNGDDLRVFFIRSWQFAQTARNQTGGNFNVNSSSSMTGNFDAGIFEENIFLTGVATYTGSGFTGIVAGSTITKIVFDGANPPNE